MPNVDNNLNGLEAQVNSLLKALHQLRLENTVLSQKMAQLERDFQLAKEKNQAATIEINRIITKLKEEIK